MNQRPDANPNEFADVLRAFMERERRTNSDLAQLTGISVRTIEKWSAGEARRPRFVADLLKVARGLALGPDEADALLHAAGHSSIARLTAQAEQAGDTALLGLLDRWRPAAPASRAGQTALHQLRAPVADFSGRAQELAGLLAALAGAAGPPPAGCVVGIHGMGGVGKTELATRVAHGALTLFPDAQLVVELHGASEAPVPSAEALRQLIRALDADGAAVRSDDLGALQRRYLTLLHDRRVLVLLDDARDVEQVRPLLPPAGSALLITSRQRFTLPGMVGVHLEPLGAEAPDLLRAICGRLDPAEAAAIAHACMGLPLALRVSAGILQNNPALRVGQYVARLADIRQRLRQLSDPDDVRHDVAASLALSYDLLDERSRQLFRQLGVLVTDFESGLAAAVAGVTAAEIEPILHLLLRRNLLRYAGERERWSCHDLVRALALERLAAAGEEEAAGWRYACAVCAIAEEIQAAYLGGVQATAAATRFDAERPHLDAAWRWALARAASGRGDTLILNLALATQAIGRLRYHAADDLLPRFAAAQAAAQRLGDQLRLYEMLRLAAVMYQELGEPQQALAMLEQTVAGAESLGEQSLLGRALRDLSTSLVHLSGPANIEAALGYQERALAIFQAAGDERAACMMLNNIGIARLYLGATPAAVDAFEEALVLARTIGYQAGEPVMLGNLGRAYTKLEQHTKAIATFEQALALNRSIGNQRSRGIVLSCLGDSHLALGDLPRALVIYEEALALLRAQGDQRNAAFCAWDLGRTLVRAHQRERGLALMREALAYNQRVGRPEAAAQAVELAAVEAAGSPVALDTHLRTR